MDRPRDRPEQTDPRQDREVVKKTYRGPCTHCFVQVSDVVPGVGIDTSTGQAWIGVDRHVSVGSADALFLPGWGSGTPQYWSGLRSRMLNPPFRGELWWYIDALGQSKHSTVAEIARELAGPTVEFDTDSDGIVSMKVRLTGEHAHPRGAAQIAGLWASSTREQVREFLGRDMIGDPDEFGVEGRTSPAQL